MKKNLINYLFYKLVEFTFHLRGLNDVYNATLIMSALFISNILSVLMCFIDGGNVRTLILTGIYLFIFLNIILAVAYWGKGGKRILEYYEDETNEDRIRGNTITIWYVILTIALFALSLYFWNKR